MEPFNKSRATHRVVYMTQARVESLVEADKDGNILSADPMLQRFVKMTLNDVRNRMLVMKVEELHPVIPKEQRKIQLTDE